MSAPSIFGDISLITANVTLMVDLKKSLGDILIHRLGTMNVCIEF